LRFFLPTPDSDSPIARAGAEIGVEITLRLTSGGERKRVAILVTKESHCLEALVRDHRGGKLHPECATAVAAAGKLSGSRARRRGTTS
jgi:formyltetrahydrofolate deformylase